MKLEVKKIIYVGLAFFLITTFWQTYDSIITKILIDKFGLNQTWSGVVMALDNVLALILLPLFGWMSDRTNSRLGRRTPYIIVGTIIGAFAFMALSFSDVRQQTMIDDNTTIVADYESLLDANASQTYMQAWEQLYVDMLFERQGALSSGMIDQATFDRFESNIANPIAQILYAGGQLRPMIETEESEILTDAYYLYLNNRAWELTVSNPTNFIVFIGVLFIALVSMSTFRSPAVALMPDVTIKPLRSKANAIINLLGTFGGILAILILTVFGLDRLSYVNYTAAFISVGVIMLFLLAIFLWKVREPKLVQERELLEIKLNIQDVEEEVTEASQELDKEKKIALYLILASIFLWFFGYNAVTTKLSDYAPKVFDMGFTIPLLVAQGAALVAFVPIGILATRIGRKKTILMGIALLTFCFGSIYFFVSPTPLVFVIFGLTGIAWATINVNSFPMVAELAKGSNVGKYTGYYYTFSMAAQILTPIFSGILMDMFSRRILFPYATIFVALSFFTMMMVKHGDAILIKKDGLLESFDVDMD